MKSQKPGLFILASFCAVLTGCIENTSRADKDFFARMVSDYRQIAEKKPTDVDQLRSFMDEKFWASRRFFNEKTKAGEIEQMPDAEFRLWMQMSNLFHDFSNILEVEQGFGEVSRKTISQKDEQYESFQSQHFEPVGDESKCFYEYEATKEQTWKKLERNLTVAELLLKDPDAF